MANLIKHSSTSNLIRFTLKHSTTGDGLTGLSSASSGLIISTIADNEATATTYTVAGSTIETIATLGTYAAPTATKCRFKEVDATNHQGLYEFQFADARFSVASAKRLVISVTGATNLLDSDYEIQLVQFDPYDSVRAGLTALPNAAADAAGGLPISDAGGLDLDAKIGALTFTVANQVDSNVITKTGFSVSSTGLDAVLFDSTFSVALAKAVWTDTLTTYTDGMAGKRLKGLSVVPSVEGTVNDAAATTTSFATTLTGYGDNFFNDSLLLVELATDQWQPAPVASYTSATGVFTFDEGFISAPANGVNITVQSTHIHTVSSIFDAILTTQMTENYAADGTAPTLEQAIMLIQQMLTEFAISGTTYTAKKLDGSTTAATFTLDDGTNPTSLTRAT